jgi:hypothetical protein
VSRLTFIRYHHRESLKYELLRLKNNIVYVLLCPTHIVLCFFSSSCVPYVASFSGLFIIDCPSLFSNVYLIDINGKYQLLIMLLISMSKYIRYQCVLTNTHALRIIQENNISLTLFSNFKQTPLMV